MKKFRFATIHLILVGLIFFGTLTASLRLAVSDSVKILLFLVISAGVSLLLFYQKKGYDESDLERIERLNVGTEQSLKQLLDKMPVGVVKFDSNLQSIEWFNPYAELIFSDQEGNFNSSLVFDILTSQKENPMTVGDINGKKYSLTVDFTTGILYFYDNLSDYWKGDSTSAVSPVIGIISIDNYDDTIENLADEEVSRLNALIVKFVADFTQKHHIFYRRVDMNRFYFFTDYAVLNQLMETKFAVLEEFRQKAKEITLPLTMSMGISYGDSEHDEIGAVAQKNLNMALVRGGDQVVVKENATHGDFVYFGGSTVSTVKRSRTRTRAMMTAISDKIKTVDQVFIMGHRNLDMDALGAAVGMEFFASNLITKTYTIYDNQKMAPDIERAVNRLKSDGNSNLITIEEALDKITSQSLLIMVDHSKISLTLSKEVYDNFTDVIVVDHHRRDDDFPKNAVLTFIESGASSASELVTELIQFQNAPVKLSKLQASVLMAGIMLDTKNFSTRVTSRTFDVGSYLRTLGSDSVEIHNISAIDFDEYRLINELILRGEKSEGSVIIASGSEDKPYSNVISSKAADALLDMSGIEAAFVVTKNAQGYTAISARSRSKINVQRIMEELGGGGHFNLAACQIENQSVSEALLLLKEKIKEELEVS